MYSWIVQTKKAHGPTWYIVAAIATASLAIWGFLTQIYALSVVVVILAGVYLLVENNAPDAVEAVVNENGVGIGEMFYDYGQIAGFTYIFDGPVAKYLQIQLRDRRALPMVLIPFTNAVNPSELRGFLLNYLEEYARKELSFTDKLADHLSL